MARRGTRGEQYAAIAAFFGSELAEELRNPIVPEFVLVHKARQAAHYGLTALRLEKRSPRPSLPARLTESCQAAGLSPF